MKVVYYTSQANEIKHLFGVTGSDLTLSMSFNKH